MKKLLTFVSKLIPLKYKLEIAHELRLKLGLITAGKPGSQNYWWNLLEQSSNKSLFPVISDEAKNACQEIREYYKPILDRHKINHEDFFEGSIKKEEAEILYQMILERKPENVYQIGTFVGYSAIVIAHALKACGKGRIVAVDPEIPHRTFINPVEIAKQIADEIGLSQNICFIKGWHSISSGDYVSKELKRAIPVIGTQVLQEIAGGIDFAFIDGDHSTSCTMADFLILKDYINRGGVAVFHDAYSWPTVAQAINIIWNDIHYFVRGTRAYFDMDVRRGFDGLVALQRSTDELVPTLKLIIYDSNKKPISNAIVKIPQLNYESVTGDTGEVYILDKIHNKMNLSIEHEAYIPYKANISNDSYNDYLELEINLESTF